MRVEKSDFQDLDLRSDDWKGEQQVRPQAT